MAKFEVEMVAFKSQGEDYGIRTVEVPDKELTGKWENDLERVFYWGQNDFQPQRTPSVSCGDIIRYEGRRYLMKAIGFEEVGPDEKGGFLKGYGLQRIEKKN
jgi:hypothetical protein